MAQFPWVVNGIERLEAQVLEELAILTAGFPDLAARVLAFPWLSAAESIGNAEANSVTSLVDAAYADPELALVVADYPWVRDSLTPSEYKALSAIFRLSAADAETARKFASLAGFIEGSSLETVGDGAGGLASLFEEDPAAAGLAVTHLSLDDGISETEIRTLAGILAMARASGPANSGAAEATAGFPWVADGLTFGEFTAVKGLADLVHASELLESSFGLILTSQDWVRDGISEPDKTLLDILDDLLSASRRGGAQAAESLLAHQWVGDGITGEDRAKLHRFADLLDAAGSQHGVAVATLAGHDWVADGLSDLENDTVYIFLTLLESASGVESTLPERVASLPWVADGITPPEPDAINRIRDLQINSQQSDLDFAERLVTFEWVSDGLTPEEMDVLQIVETLMFLARDDGRAADGVKISDLRARCADLELNAIGIPVSEFPASARGNPVAIVRHLLDGPWLAESPRIRQVEALLLIMEQTLEWASANEALVSGWLADYPWSTRGITAFECSALARLGNLLVEAGDDLLGISWFEDGINDEELALLAVLDEIRKGSQQRYRDMLNSPYVQSAGISLPLGGEVKFFAFQDFPFPGPANHAEDMGRFARFVEDFLAVPFPRKTVVARTITKKGYDDEDERNVGGGYSIRDQIVFTASDAEFEAPEILLHEMAHIYFGGHIGAPTWLIEGAAEFLAFYAPDDAGRLPLSDRRSELTKLVGEACARHGVDTVQELLDLEKSDPEQSRERGICNYHLGEILLLDIYELADRDSLGASMRELYLRATDTRLWEPITEEQIHNIFRSNVPAGKVDAFDALYARYHGGAYADG